MHLSNFLFNFMEEVRIANLHFNQNEDEKQRKSLLMVVNANEDEQMFANLEKILASKKLLANSPQQIG
jgi:hypothetical protein